MKSCISCGTCDKKYFCIILGFIISHSLVVPFTISDNKFSVNENFLYCIFIFFLGHSLCFIPELIYKKPNKKEIKVSSRTTIKSTRVIYYIFNKNNNNTKFTFKEMIIFFFMCLIFLLKYILIYINVKNYYDINNVYINITKFNESTNNTYTNTNINETNINKDNVINDEYIFFSYIIIFIVSAFVFKNIYYKHQYFSIIVLVLLGLSKLLIRITFLQINYNFILMSFLLEFITAIIYGYLKGLMKYKFFSIYKCNYLPGLINIVIIIICYFSFGNEINNFINQTNNKNISIKFNVSNIIFSILTLIGSTFYGLFMNQILNNYTIFHIFLPLNLLNFLYLINDTAQIKDNLIEYVLLIIIDFFEFIIMLVFLELIEINLCSLSYNTKENIRKRANKESSDLDSQNKNNENDNPLIKDEMEEEDSAIIEDENEKIELKQGNK
jgi:hypothetical protein